MARPANNKTAVAVFGGGCFWCAEAVFAQLRGVVSVAPGYAGGSMSAPTYKEVCSGRAGHAEVIKIEFNPDKISYADLLAVFFVTHDPTTLNRQGNDVGSQYRSVIFYSDERQKKEAQDFIAKLRRAGVKAATELKPLARFYEAEEEHRDYYAKNPGAAYCQIVINPKLEKLKQGFRDLLKEGG